MTREEHLARAEVAVTRAAGLARDAEGAARSNDNRHKVEPLAAAAALWADIARAHADIAAARTQTTGA